MLRLAACARVFVLSGGLLLAGAGLLPLTGHADAAALSQKDKERHPHIRRALHELREAKKELQTANHDFGGHRKEALEAVEVAIKQLDLALKYDKR